MLVVARVVDGPELYLDVAVRHVVVIGQVVRQELGWFRVDVPNIQRVATQLKWAIVWYVNLENSDLRDKPLAMRWVKQRSVNTLSTAG